MRTAAQMVAARLPPSDAARPHDPMPCAICGGVSSRGAPVGDVCGSLTTDLTSFRSPSSPLVCEGCILTRGRSVNPPGRESGWFCNFSHFADAERYENASKGEKPRILAWLRGPKVGAWFCAVADTGQKHLVCYAPINPPGSRGRVRFEEADVALPDADGWRLVDEMTALLTAGATKEEIETSRYTARAHTLCGETLRTFERVHGRLRGGSWFGLALWLAQRDEATVQARLEREKEAKAAKKTKPARARKVAKDAGRCTAGAAENADSRDDVGVPEGLSQDRSERAEALANPTEPDAVCGGEHGQRGRVGDAGAAPAPDPDVGQLGLFGALGPQQLRSRARRVG